MSQERLWELISKKLSGEASTAELKELHELLRSNPDLHYPIQTISDLWQHKPRTEEDAQSAFERHSRKMTAAGIRLATENQEKNQGPHNDDVRGNSQKNNLWGRLENSKKRTLFAATGVLALVTILLSVYFLAKDAGVLNVKPAIAKTDLAKSEISTKYGSKTKLILPDGSKVWLNAGSRLIYDKNFNSNLREVVLEGEAFFDVTRNAAKPFIIHTRKIDIKVLGTSFNVKSYPEENSTETSLIHGSIEVTIKDRIANKIVLKPNQKLVIANNDSTETISSDARKKRINPEEPFIAISHLTYARMDSTVIETSWVQNKLIFTSETFEDLAIKMERWYDVRINFSDPTLRKKKFTGTFENETVQQALEAMQLTTPFTYNINKKEVTISYNKPLILKTKTIVYAK